MLIKYDTREKYPWDFSFYGAEMIRTKVDTGDYTIDGMENLVSIERKRNTGEIANNLGKKWKQFKSELDRMVNIKHKFIICEFLITDLSTFPVNSGIPEKDWKYLRMNAGFIQSRLFSEAASREIEVLFFSSPQQTEAKVYDILKGIYERYKN